MRAIVPPQCGQSQPQEGLGSEVAGVAERVSGAGLQQLPAERQEFTAAPIGEEAAEANAHKAARQGVEQEAPQELFGGDRHQPLLARAHSPSSGR